MPANAGIHGFLKDDHPQQLPPFASLLALFVEGATSLPGFWSKNPTGISLNPAVMQGCTGKSSGRG
jgi:hypothetical protein